MKVLSKWQEMSCRNEPEGSGEGGACGAPVDGKTCKPLYTFMAISLIYVFYFTLYSPTLHHLQTFVFNPGARDGALTQ